MKTLILSCFAFAMFAIQTTTAQTTIFKVKGAEPVENGGETRVLLMDEAENGTLTCVEKVFATEKEALKALKEGDTEAGRTVQKTKLDAAKVALLEEGDGTVIPRFPVKIQYARFRGPKTKIARRFGEPIIGSHKALEK